MPTHINLSWLYACYTNGNSTNICSPQVTAGDHVVAARQHGEMCRWAKSVSRSTHQSTAVWSILNSDEADHTCMRCNLSHAFSEKARSFLYPLLMMISGACCGGHVLTWCSLANAEMRLILAKVLWSFHLELVDKGWDWMAEQKVFTL